MAAGDRPAAFPADPLVDPEGLRGVVGPAVHPAVAGRRERPAVVDRAARPLVVVREVRPLVVGREVRPLVVGRAGPVPAVGHSIDLFDLAALPRGGRLARPVRVAGRLASFAEPKR